MRVNDKDALKALFEAHYPAVCGTIQRLVGERGITEDLAQQVFIRFWEKSDRIQIETSPGAYLHRMAVNEALAWLRAKKNRQHEELTPAITLPRNSSGGEEQLLREELNLQINKAIELLPPRCREVFQLSRFEDFSYQEIADEMGISVKTVEHQMGKALRTLRESLSPYVR